MRLNILVALLLIFIVAPNARPIFKYVPYFQGLAMLLYSAGFFWLVFLFYRNKYNSLVVSYVGSWRFICFLLFVCAVLVWYMYPVADGLKLKMRGSDQDDCVIIGVKQILNLSHPYIIASYYGNPCSPGLGMLLLYLPFVVFDAYPFGAIAFIGGAIFSVWRFGRSLYKAGFFAVLILSSIYSIEMLVVGSDLFLLGCGLVILALGVVRAVTSQSVSCMVWLALLAGLLASTRVNFLVLVPIMSFFIFIRWGRGGVVFGLISAFVALLPSMFVYYLNPLDFTPFHLLGKSQNLLSGWLREGGVLISLVGFSFGAYLVRVSVRNVPVALYLSLIPSLFAVSVGDLLLRGFDFSLWEGANYLLPLLPLSVMLLVNMLVSDSVGSKLK